MSEVVLKVIVIGDPAVGKTSFIQKCASGDIKPIYKPTLSVDFKEKILRWSEEETVKLQLWDIAGQERFTYLTRVYFKDTKGCLIMFDVSSKASFLNALKWKRELDSKCRLPNGRCIPCVLIGNKCDLTDREVDEADIIEAFKKHKFTAWAETSAIDGVMVEESVRSLVDAMMPEESDDSEEDFVTFSLTEDDEQPVRRKCFC